MVINVYARLVVFSTFVSIIEVLDKKGCCLNGGWNAKSKHLASEVNIYVEYLLLCAYCLLKSLLLWLVLPICRALLLMMCA